MCHNAGKLTFVGGFKKQAAIDTYICIRTSKCVDSGRINDEEAKGLACGIRVADQFLAQTFEIVIQLRIFDEFKVGPQGMIEGLPQFYFFFGAKAAQSGIAESWKL